MIDAALENGRDYPPYRLHATPARFAQAYPEFADFNQSKARADSRGKSRNLLWNRHLYAPTPS